jgi:MFS family permease
VSAGFGLLRRRPRFAALWGAIGLSYAGSGAATTALTLYVQQTRGTGIAVAVLLIAATAPKLLGPLAGVIADRVDLRRLMIGCDLGQALLFAAMATLPPFGVLIALIATTTLLQCAYSPARTAAVPVLVEEGELIEANALLGTATNLYIAVGPLIGGLLFAAGGGAELPLLVNVVTFLGSAALGARLPALPPEIVEVPESLLRAVRTGGAFVWGNRVTRAVVTSICAILVFLAVDNVAMVFLVRETLSGSAAAFGIVSAVFGVGMLIGSFAMLRGTSMPATRIYLLSLALSSAGSLLTAIAPAVAVVALVQLVAGAGNGIEVVANETILQQQVPRRMLGRVYGFMTTATALGLGISTAFGGFLVDATSPRAAFLIGGTGGVAVTLLAARALWHVDVPASGQPL